MSYGLIAHIYPACSRPTSPCPDPCLAERLCKSVKVQNTFYPGLVAHLLEVLAQLDDRVEGVGRLDRVGVVGDEERLCGLVGDDAFLALWECQCVCVCRECMGGAPSWPLASRRSTQSSCTCRR
jgi:hypothetical protein